MEEKIVLELENGRYYGEVALGKRHGEGTFTDTNGNEFTGQWKNDCLNGYASARFSDGGVYVGTFRNNKAHGLGTYISPEKTKYVGQWKEDNMNGQGRLYDSGGRLIYDGEWVGGKPKSDVH